MFANRQHAGKLLAEKLEQFRRQKDTIVIGIPRGGVVVAKEVSRALKLPLDIIVIKKIGAPQNPELAIGAAGPKGSAYWDDELCGKLMISRRDRNFELEIKEKEREEREKFLRGKKLYNLKDRIAILADDGVATGATVLCAGIFLKKERARKVILSAPVIAKDTFNSIKRYFDRIIVLSVEADFYAVGQFYQEFPQVSDEEVIGILNSP